MNPELEQYLKFFIDHRQKDWLKWLMSTEFAVNNKIHLVIKVSLFIVDYGRELRMGTDIRRKGKVEKATEFAERIKKIQEKVEMALRKAQEEMKQQADCYELKPLSLDNRTTLVLSNTRELNRDLFTN